MVKKKISLTIDQDIFEDFRDYCKRNGMKISTKVERLMKASVDNTSLKKFIE